MRPRLKAAENLDSAGALVPGDGASMRPRLKAAENVRVEAPAGPRAAASMRPRLKAAENPAHRWRPDES